MHLICLNCIGQILLKHLMMVVKQYYDWNKMSVRTAGPKETK